MSFDEEPDAPLHGECADAIHTLQAEVASLKKIIALNDAATRECVAENDLMREALTRVAECEPQADEGAFMRCAMCGCVWPGSEPHETEHEADCVWMAAKKLVEQPA